MQVLRLPVSVLGAAEQALKFTDLTETPVLTQLVLRTHLNGSPNTCRDQHQQARLFIQQEEEDDHSTETTPEHWGHEHTRR